jgi:ABC-type transport system involved in cytochrome bd biosynthesis fused ATPase/permease subunit
MMPRPETAHPTTLLFLVLVLRPFVSLYLRLSFPFFSFFVPPHLLSMALLILRSPASCVLVSLLLPMSILSKIKKRKRKKEDKKKKKKKKKNRSQAGFPPSS